MTFERWASSAQVNSNVAIAISQKILMISMWVYPTTVAAEAVY